MSIKKRIMSAALTAAMVASLPTAAYASGEKLELVVDTETPCEVCEYDGENKYLYDNEDGDRLLISITEDDIADFAKSGELSYTEIANLNELFECGEGESAGYFTDYLFNNGYAVLFKRNSEDVISNRYCVYYDGSELSVIDEFENYCGVSANGYVANLVKNSDGTTINITAPDGTVKSLNYGADWAFYSAFYGDSENIIFVTVDSSTFIGQSDWGALSEYKMTMHIINENGKVRDVPVELNGKNYGIGSRNVGENFMFYKISFKLAVTPKVCIYLTDNDETLQLSSFPDSKTGIVVDGKIYNDILIATFTPYGEDTEEVSALIDISQEGKQISEGYSRMYTADGEIYLAEKADGTWGYLNNKGKELAFFDDASDFIGDYAPVIKDGKAYLIDRNMNIVSDGVEADGVSTIGENLYTIRKGEERYLMTFKLNDSAATDEPVADEPIADEPVADEPIADEPVADEPIADEPIADEPVADEPVADEPAADTPVVDTDVAVDTGKDNPDTGAEGIAAIAAIGITAIGAALLSKKKK